MNYAPSFFSDDQKRVLRTLWIPALFALVWISLTRLVPYIPGELNLRNFSGIYVALFFCWEEIVKRDYKKAAIIFAAGIALEAGSVLTVNYLRTHNPEILITVLTGGLIYIIDTISITLIAAFVSKKENAWKVGLLSGAAVYTWSFMGTGFPLFFEERVLDILQLHRFWDLRISYLITGPSIVFVYYCWYYLADNLFNQPDYRQQLQSKIQVITGNEYFLLFAVTGLTAWSTILNTASIVNNFFEIFGGHSYNSPTVSMYVDLIGSAAMLIISGYLMRNVVISRMMTTAKSNGWLYMLHFIPVLNIIPWIILRNKPVVHSTREENAVFYLTRGKNTIATFIVVTGVILSAIGLFSLLASNGLRGTGEASIQVLALVLCIIKIGCYLVLQKNRNAVFVLLSVNALSLLLVAVLSRYDMMMNVTQLLITYLSYYFIMETFHPQLEGNDVAFIPENYLEIGATLPA